MTGSLNNIDKTFAATALFEGLKAPGRDLSSLADLPWPTLRDEAWRYTNLSFLAKRKFRVLSRVEGVLPEGARSWILPEAINIVLVNGIFSKELSSSLTSLEGVKITVGDKKMKGRSIETRNDDPLFLALNKALSSQTILIRVEPEVVLSRPIQILHVLDGKIGAPASFAHIQVELSRQAQATFLETFLSFDQDEYLCVPLTDIILAEGASLERAQLHHHAANGFHIGTTRIDQAKDSRSNSFLLTTGARIFRDNLSLIINGEGAEAVLNGLHALKGDRHADSHTFVEHREPNTRSDQLYKCILQDSSQSVFNGRIFVDPKAQQTNSYQLNKNLILSRECRVDTKPQLEIGADDVKCTHGATIGQLNPNELFYLQTRAINKIDAEKMLIRGFMDDILGQITAPVLRDAAFKMAGL